MHNKTFSKLLDQLKKLTPSQKEKLQSTLHHADAEEKVSTIIDTVESCPHCNSKSHQKWGVRSNLQRYRCNECHKTYNDSPVPHWQDSDTKKYGWTLHKMS